VFGPVAYAVNLIGLGPSGGAAFTIDTALFYLATPSGTTSITSRPSRPCRGSAVIFAGGPVLSGVFLLRTRAYPRLLRLVTHKRRPAAYDSGGGIVL
jgi:hypothetical protein